MREKRANELENLRMALMEELRIELGLEVSAQRKMRKTIPDLEEGRGFRARMNYGHGINQVSNKYSLIKV